MALIEKEYQVFKQVVLQAMKEANANEIVYRTEWIFDFPGHDLQVHDNSIINKYHIKTGWNGFGEIDLERMVNEGLIEKIHVSEGDPETLEKIIIFKII